MRATLSLVFFLASVSAHAGFVLKESGEFGQTTTYKDGVNYRIERSQDGKPKSVEIFRYGEGKYFALDVANDETLELGLPQHAAASGRVSVVNEMRLMNPVIAGVTPQANGKVVAFEERSLAEELFAVKQLSKPALVLGN